VALALTLTLTILSTFTVTPTTTMTITESSSPTSRAASLIDGRCQGDKYKGWKCSRKSFACKERVCIDRRTPKQKEADKHDAVDGKNGRCAYNYDAQSYYCTQRGFVCIDEMVCADHRTAEKAEDEALRVEKKRKVKRVAAIVNSTFEGVVGVALWRGKPGREQAKEQAKSDRPRATGGAGSG
jgi:hypothetical protein